MWLINFATSHWASIVAFGGLVITSGIKTMPPPDMPFHPYQWAYDWLHQFFNLPNNRLAQQAIPTPPLSAGETNK